MNHLYRRAILASIIALIPMIGLDQFAQNYDGLAAVTIRFVGAALIFAAALAVTNRLKRSDA